MLSKEDESSHLGQAMSVLSSSSGSDDDGSRSAASPSPPTSRGGTDASTGMSPPPTEAPPAAPAAPGAPAAQGTRASAPAPEDDFHPTVKGKTKHSKRIPHWLWIILAKSLGIRLTPNDKPIVSSVLHVLTMGSAAGMLFCNVWFSGYDILSIHSTTDIIDGIVAILMTLFYCGLGVYAHRLAYRLLVHPKFVQNLRLHSKSVMKLNTALVVFLLTAGFVVTQNLLLARYGMFYVHIDDDVDVAKNATAPPAAPGDRVQDEEPETIPASTLEEAELNPCQNIRVPVLICQSFFVFQLVFSLFFLLWNVLVAVVLISVARTHTIDIRKFMNELGFDAHLQDRMFRRNFYRPETAQSRDTLRQYLWVDHDRIANMMDQVARDGRRFSPAPAASSPWLGSTTAAGASEARPRLRSGRRTASTSSTAAILEEEEPPVSFSATHLQLDEDEVDADADVEARSASTSAASSESRQSPVRLLGRFHRLTGGGEGEGDADHDEDDEDREARLFVPHIMPEQEIMHKYWKLASSTRLTSLAFQRWMCCVTVTILFWSALRIIYWLSHSPTLYGMLMFILPLLLLPLLASAYAEVNYEGVKVIQSIMPTPGRITLFQYLYGMPIQMTAYGHGISYGTMGTVLAAILAALTSKVLLQEMNKVMN